MTTHQLKTAPSFFNAVWDGRKTFEVRLNDRGYQAGDNVVLHEFDTYRSCDCESGYHDRSRCARYSGRQVHAGIGYVLGTVPGMRGRDGFDGHGWVIFSLVDALHVETKAATPTPLLLDTRASA